MSGCEHRGPAREALDEMILMKLYPLLVALFLCLSVTKGFVPEEPKYVNATLGESVVLFCGFEYPENYPVPHTIVWYKEDINGHIFSQMAQPDGPPKFGVGYEGRLSLVHQDSLNLTNVQVTDQGWYECRVYFEVHFLFIPNCTRVHLEVYGNVPEEPKHVNVAIGEGAVLFCNLEFPENKPESYVIEWYKQGIKEPIFVRLDGYPPSLGFGYEGRLSLVDQASLHILKVQETDQGWYECNKVFYFHEPLGIVNNDTWVHLDVYDFVPEEPKHVNATLGEDVLLFCGFKFPENKPQPYELQWYKQDIKDPIYTRLDRQPPISGFGYEGRLSLAGHASLHLVKVRETDQGWYECMVEFLNRPPGFYMEQTVVHLDVHENGQEEPKHVNATLGGDVLLFCGFKFPENKPEPYKLQWYKEDIEDPIYTRLDRHPPISGFGYEGRLSLTGHASLHLVNVRETDQGWYECRVEFLNRPLEFHMYPTLVHLDVHENWQEEPKHVNATLGEDVLLYCGFKFPENKPEPYELQWYKDPIEDPIYTRSDRHPPISGFGYEGRLSLAGHASLHLVNVRETDQGWYECRVKFLNRPLEFHMYPTLVHLDVHGDLSNQGSAITAGVVVFFFLAALSISVGMYKFVIKRRKEKQRMLLISNSGSTGSLIDILDDPLDDNQIKRLVVQ